MQNLIPGRSRARAIVAGLGLALLAGAAQATSINFDGLPDGTVLRTRYAGVVLTEAVKGGEVYARTTPASQSPTNVVSVFPGGVPAYGAYFGAVQAVFSAPQRTVSIDAAAMRVPEGLGNPLNRPFLQAFDSSGVLLDTVYFQGALPPAGGVTPYETLTYTSASANIARVLFSVQQSQPGPSVYGYFDNLNFATSVGSGLVRYDDFNSKRWVETFIGSGITNFTKSSKMNMVVAANAAGDPFVGRLDSLCLLRGDFDLSVEYNFPAFQQGSGVRTGLVVPGAGHIERTSGSSHDVGPGGEIYYGVIGGASLEAVPTGDVAGKLRLTRVGSAMSAYYSGGKSTAWKLLGTGKVALDDLPFQLQVWSHDPYFDDRKVTVQFDNVTLNSGKLVGPSCPTPTP